MLRFFFYIEISFSLLYSQFHLEYLSCLGDLLDNWIALDLALRVVSYQNSYFMHI